eukprot:TRINITY_DN1010_c1_g1_i1.p1 TRINITY_DN1010_c1_g1~~TRINITY_DN1010_c1_g1_i1.p1  ORF type:complete len:509 (-),score=141.64 TRINITY_DN1010_c1_g1_i1:67-1593(-)
MKLKLPSVPSFGARFWLYCSCSGIFNYSSFFYWCCVAIVAVAADASPLQLGVMQALSALTTAVMSPVTGWAMGYLPPWGMVRGCAVFFSAASACLIAGVCGLFGAGFMYYWLLISTNVFGIAAALFWPVIQTEVGNDSGDKSDRNLAIFAVWWSAGKSLGYVSASYIFALIGAIWSTVFGAVLCSLLLVLYPVPPAACSYIKGLLHIPDESHQQMHDEYVTEQGQESGAPAHSSVSTPVIEDEKQHEVEEMAALSVKYNMAFLPMCWLFNFCNYGTLNVLNSQLGKLAVAKGISLGNFVKPDQFLGVFMCLIFFGQTFALITLACIKGRIWQYKRWVIFVFEACDAFVLVLVAFVEVGIALLPAAVLVGFGSGLAIQSSVNYSLRISETYKGTFLGIHESMIAGGSFALPLIAGILTSSIGDLRVPYLVCICTWVVAFVAQECTYHVVTRGMLQPLVSRFRRAKHADAEAPVKLETAEEGQSSEEVAAEHPENNRTSRVSCEDTSSAS